MSRSRSCRTALLLLLTAFFGGDVLAQHRMGPYAPPVGQSGSNAMYKDSSAFVAWASSCTVDRGPQDTSDLSHGYASAGSPSDATEKAGVNGVVSLGDHGSATLTFNVSIRNGPGPDLAVFENSFSDTFLELAFVEVSSNGQDFVRFPAVSLTDTSTQVSSFGSLDATNLYNLAGKYRGDYGTPFDLQELADSSSIDIDSITHVRIVDVIGCVQENFATYDSSGRVVNDPWPTAFPSSGFDLDAVGVIHSNSHTSLAQHEEKELQVHYDRASQSIRTFGIEGERSLQLYGPSGRLLFSRYGTTRDRVSLPRSLNHGVHILRVKHDGEARARKILIR